MDALLTNVGLSPPVRGSLFAAKRMARHLVPVYPRPCGGALVSRTGRRPRGSGLSPPVRGSPPLAIIPHHRGKVRVYPRPCGGAIVSPWSTLSAHTRVYPRPCGGASCDTDMTVAS